jgi:isoleucyl-tRNA synthetase
MTSQPQQPEKSQQAKIEEQVLELWSKEGTFEQSLAQREGGPTYSFYDGPPFANGLPHFGHSLVTSIKDSMLRYKTMQGYYVPRRNGWDCHGLPVEFAIEKEFGVSGKKQILELGIEKFNAACNDSVFKYKGEWESLLKRLGRWSEYDNYYATVDSNYTESVWWALAQVHKKGLLYKGYKSTPYCPRCETPLSNFEVNDGYKDNVPDPSLYVMFKLANEDAYMLGWTTTPWSLPGNAAIAVNPAEQYVYVELTDESAAGRVVVLAKKRLEALGHDNYKVVKEVSGQDLVGKSYLPVFEVSGLDGLEGSDNLYRIWPADFVSIEDGTGVLHVAPAFGEDDLNLGLQEGIPVLQTIDASGKVTEQAGVPEATGKFFKGADKLIIENLTEKGLVYLAETKEHTYPFCWRCETPLMYYAISSWFIRVSSIRDQLMKTAEEINWTPAHIKSGRFGQWIEGARDWAISRNRYWGAPMPIWVNVADETDYIVVESYEELRKLTGNSELDTSDVHRPIIDDVVIERDGKTYRRVEEVLDCWFESGTMSLAQHHYPFENKEAFDQAFPADFIIEGLDQTRLWFYVQHVVNTILFDAPAYKNVIVNGMIMAADGQKLSKRLQNYPPVDEVFNQEGADSLRLYLLSSHQASETAEYIRFNRDAMRDIQRNVLGTLLNSQRFFTMYADIDGWKPAQAGARPQSDNVLDQWMLARIDQTVIEATKEADGYQIAHAITPVFSLIDDMSNWYIRRSRRRFWKSEDDGDKAMAYETLWYALIRICQLLAPWAPFVSDYVWRELVRGTDMPASVHLSDWPAADKTDTSVITNMALVRETIKEALALRAEAGIKVRQPLSKLVVTAKAELDVQYSDIIRDEVNVKQVEVRLSDEAHAPQLDTDITPELQREGIMRDIVRLVQNARKQAGLDVDDRIELGLTSTSTDIVQAITEHSGVIEAETLATVLTETVEGHSTQAKVGEAEVTISLRKHESL